MLVLISQVYYERPMAIPRLFMLPFAIASLSSDTGNCIQGATLIWVARRIHPLESNLMWQQRARLNLPCRFQTLYLLSDNLEQKVQPQKNKFVTFAENRMMVWVRVPRRLKIRESWWGILRQTVKGRNFFVGSNWVIQAIQLLQGYSGHQQKVEWHICLPFNKYVTLYFQMAFTYLSHIEPHFARKGVSVCNVLNEALSRCHSSVLLLKYFLIHPSNFCTSILFA